MSFHCFENLIILHVIQSCSIVANFIIHFFCKGPATKQTLSHESDQEKQQFSPKKVQFNTRQSFPHGLLAEGALEEDWESCSEGDDPEDGGDTASRRSEVIIEDSFQERMKKWDELEVVSTVV